jgi:DNA-binding GntR family transcriptional regulator
LVSDSLSLSAYERCKNDIITCQLKPGQFVTEAELAERYGVSKSPIRFALALLTAEDLVAVAPRRGIQVASLTIGDVRHVYTLRGLLEPFASAQAAAFRTDEDLAALDSLVELATAKGENILRTDQIRAHTLFHVRIAQASRIPKLVRLIQPLHETMERVLHAVPSVGRRWSFGTRDHELLDAVRRGSSEEAEKLSRQHIAEATDNMTQTFTALLMTMVDGVHLNAETTGGELTL